MTFAEGSFPGDYYCAGDAQEVFWDEYPSSCSPNRGMLHFLTVPFQFLSRYYWTRRDPSIENAKSKLTAQEGFDCEGQKKSSDEDTIASASSNGEAAAMGYMEFESEHGNKGEPAPSSDGKEEQTVPWTAYFLLASTVVGLSSVGPLLSFQDEGGVTFKILWRSSAFALALSPFVVFNVIQEGLSYLPWEDVGALVVAGVSYGTLAILFSWSLCYTTVGNAVVFGNTQSIILLIGGGITGQTISMAE